jgi:hypothetical protein
VSSRLRTAQHEAAHVVVGVALGLRLREACLRVTAWPDGTWSAGHVTFPSGPREALAIMYAAGIAYERAARGRVVYYQPDLAELRAIVSGRAGERACIRAAAAILEARASAHEAVTRALLERDLRARDITCIARGEPLAE